MSCCRITGSPKPDFEKLDCSAQSIWVHRVLTFDLVPWLSGFPLRLFGRNVKRQEQHYGQVLAKMRAQPLWRLLVGCSAIAMLVTAAVVTFDHEIHLGGPEVKDLKYQVFLFCYIFAITLAVARPTSIWWLSITVTILYFVTCIYLLFSPAKYSEFLRILGYGGGLSVRVELRDTETTSKIESSTQQLMLRTNEAVILYDQQRAAFIEIPRDQVHRIVHGIGGMRRLPFALPEKVNRWGDG